MKRIFLTVMCGACVCVAIALLVFSNNTLRAQLKANGATGNQLQEEISRVQAERDKIMKEVERLQEDAVSYLALNGKLKAENEKLSLSLTEARKLLKDADADLEKERAKAGAFERDAQKKEQKSKTDIRLIEQAKKELARANKKMEQEEQAYRYNLGVAYTKAKLYREAAAEYEKALVLDPRNKEAHYNLGLLYDKVLSDKEKALIHYRAFLELAPQGQDKRDVQDWIDKLAK
jgi:tetratricopeptide (TPR) repeat protein